MNRDEALIRRNEDGEHAHYAPLEQMLAMAAFEFSQLPPVRQKYDYPDSLAYFLSRNGDTLVMLRRRRPLGFGMMGRPMDTHKDGYFAEVFDIGGEDQAQNQFSRLAALDGLYKRIDVTDEETDPYYGSVGVTPTIYRAIYRRILGQRIQDLPGILPSAENATVGPLGKLFAQKDVRDAGREISRAEDSDVRTAIINKYFPVNASQGLTTKIGNDHFVITEDENSSLVTASRDLGVVTHVVKAEVEDWSNPDFNHVEKLLDAQGLHPYLISLDMPSFVRSGRVIPRTIKDLVVQRLLRFAEAHPLYAYLEWERDDTESIDVGRVDPGWYHFGGNDPDVIRKILMKIGTDYLLTTTVREKLVL
ncbi:MAG: hypothetical protein HY429_00945 [Candidatus Levybacteria bacterium]|nr:hypothetical protein [Candidatus Daviesbacteria bacterium]MBI4078845.1 hypothetical protein [Candidatus Levybacteria bacterium]